MAENELEQNIKYIKLDDLVLWTGNPRDPVDQKKSYTDIDIDMVSIALEDANEKWNLKKLHNDMFLGSEIEQTSSLVYSEIGNHYDTSELPTVVESRDGKYIVYDGNRRIALIKYLQNREAFPKANTYFSEIDAPENIKNLSVLPCNVCNEETALQNVERKHGKTGWKALDVDYFLARYRNKPKSAFLIIEEATGLISKNKELNKSTIRDKILTEENLNSIGFGFKDGKLQSIYNKADAKIVLEELGKSIIEKEITGNEFIPGMLGKIIPKISNVLKDKIKSIDNNEDALQSIEKLALEKLSVSPKTKESKIVMFPYELHLEESDVNDLYRDIKTIDEFYQKRKNKFTVNFPRVLRFSLRILVEIASNQAKTKGVAGYTQKYFDDARIILSKDYRNSLSSNDMTQGELSRLLREGGHHDREDLQEGPEKTIELLHSGAHNYSDATDYKTACTMSIIVGEMLQISHGRKDLGI